MYIYILSSDIDAVEQKHMATSSAKYELNLAKALSRFAEVEILSTKVLFGARQKNANLTLTGIGIGRNTKFGLTKYRKISSAISAQITHKNAVMIFWGYDLRMLLPLLWIKLKYKICCVPFVYDHHSVAIKNLGKLKHMLVDSFFRFGIFLLRFFDRFILFQEKAAHELHIKKPYLISKPGVIPKIETGTHKSKNRPFRVAFCGTLNELNGIDVLLKAVPLFDENEVAIHIYGSGPMKKDVEDAAKVYTAVSYHGLVSDSELKKVYCESDLLINLRKTDDYAMNFSFPSKLFEYIGSGCPVLTTKMMDDPELEHCLYVIDTLSPESVYEGIKRVMEDDGAETTEKAGRAKEFVEKKYCFERLGKEIFEFLKAAFVSE